MEIKSLLMTPLATGYGRWSAERWAAQTVLAMRHFVEAMEPGKEQFIGPIEIFEQHEEMEKTYNL